MFGVMQLSCTFRFGNAYPFIYLLFKKYENFFFSFSFHFFFFFGIG